MNDQPQPGMTERPNRVAVEAVPAPTPLDPERWVDEHGDYLFRFALARLRDAGRAEECVQEAFIAALKAADRYTGQASERSWLTGILKNKIFDHFRRHSREASFTDLEFLDDELGDHFSSKGSGRDHWKPGFGPQHWESPEESLSRSEFWSVLQKCMDKLPPNIARVFALREVEDATSEEICRALNISPNNLWVMLHRARLGLRQCLEIHWFGRAMPGEKKKS